MTDNTPERDLDDLRPELLVLIEDRPEAQRLVVTWEKAWELYSTREYSGSEVQPEFKQDDPFTAAWSQISGVDIADIEELTPVLFVNGLLLPEGGIYGPVLMWIRRRMVEMIEEG